MNKEGGQSKGGAPTRTKGEKKKKKKKKKKSEKKKFTEATTSMRQQVPHSSKQRVRANFAEMNKQTKAREADE